MKLGNTVAPVKEISITKYYRREWNKRIKELRPALPKSTIYRLFDKKGRLLYLGYSNNIRRRMNEHFTGGRGTTTRHFTHLIHRAKVSFYEDGAVNLEELETLLTKEEKPYFYRKKFTNYTWFVNTYFELARERHENGYPLPYIRDIDEVLNILEEKGIKWDYPTPWKNKYSPRGRTKKLNRYW